MGSTVTWPMLQPAKLHEDRAKSSLILMRNLQTNLTENRTSVVQVIMLFELVERKTNRKSILRWEHIQTRLHW